MLSTSGMNAFLFSKINITDDCPSIQHMFFGATASSDVMYKNFNIKYNDNFILGDTRQTITIATVLLHPKSRG